MDFFFQIFSILFPIPNFGKQKEAQIDLLNPLFDKVRIDSLLLAECFTADVRCEDREFMEEICLPNDLRKCH